MEMVDSFASRTEVHDRGVSVTLKLLAAAGFEPREYGEPDIALLGRLDGRDLVDVKTMKDEGRRVRVETGAFIRYDLQATRMLYVLISWPSGDPVLLVTHGELISWPSRPVQGGALSSGMTFREFEIPDRDGPYRGRLRDIATQAEFLQLCPPDGVKWCWVCRRDRSRSEFYADGSSWDGLQAKCKTCELPIGRGNRWARQHGGDRVDFERLWRDDQHERCAVCAEPGNWLAGGLTIATVDAHVAAIVHERCEGGELLIAPGLDNTAFLPPVLQDPLFSDERREATCG